CSPMNNGRYNSDWMVTLPSPRGQLKRKEASEQRRSAIIKAARTVFARQGYARTVVEDIARQAEIGKGTLYLYFPSKEQVYLAALLEDARQLDQESRAAMAAAAEDWREMLRAYMAVRLKYFDEHQDFVRIYLTEFRSMCMQGKPLHAELFQLAQQGEAQLAQMFAAAAARGEIRHIDPELAAVTVSEVTRALMERRLRPWGRPVGQMDTEFALDLFCRAWELGG
ncbi:MAG TPA: helix-turn-helix domain-containing protein, partial [Bryobacteraceae bacterium]